MKTLIVCLAVSIVLINAFYVIMITSKRLKSEIEEERQKKEEQEAERRRD